VAEEVAKAAARGGYKHAALLGTRFTMSGPVYPEAFAKHALKISTPTEADQQSVDDVIFEEFVNGIFSEASRLRYDEVINRMKARGCDGVILGCALSASHHHRAQNTPALVDAQI
jgi:aspartate/glutamate racemase